MHGPRVALGLNVPPKFPVSLWPLANSHNRPKRGWPRCKLGSLLARTETERGIEIDREINRIIIVILGGFLKFAVI